MNLTTQFRQIIACITTIIILQGCMQTQKPLDDGHLSAAYTTDNKANQKPHQVEPNVAAPSPEIVTDQPVTPEQTSPLTTVVKVAKFVFHISLLVVMVVLGIPVGDTDDL